MRIVYCIYEVTGATEVRGERLPNWVNSLASKSGEGWLLNAVWTSGRRRIRF